MYAHFLILNAQSTDYMKPETSRLNLVLYLVPVLCVSMVIPRTTYPFPTPKSLVTKLVS